MSAGFQDMEDFNDLLPLLLNSQEGMTYLGEIQGFDDLDLLKNEWPMERVQFVGCHDVQQDGGPLNCQKTETKLLNDLELPTNEWMTERFQLDGCQGVQRDDGSLNYEKTETKERGFKKCRKGRRRLDEIEKKSRRMESNRKAAEKYRVKKKGEQDNMTKKFEMAKEVIKNLLRVVKIRPNASQEQCLDAIRKAENFLASSS